MHDKRRNKLQYYYPNTELYIMPEENISKSYIQLLCLQGLPRAYKGLTEFIEHYDKSQSLDPVSKAFH